MALNAVTEYVDHYRPDHSHFVDALLGDGMELKVRAFELMQMAARAPRRDDAAVDHDDTPDGRFPYASGVSPCLLVNSGSSV